MLLRSATKTDSTAQKKTLVIQPEAPKKRIYKHLTDPEPIELSGAQKKERKISDFFKKSA
jgi:hypothetical protein